MWQFFIALYFVYLILGPWWESKLLTSQKLDVAKDPCTILKRSMYISYVALLYTAWFLYNPSQSSLFNALLIAVTALVGYHANYGPEPGLPVHVILIMYLLFMGRRYVDIQTLVTMGLLSFYALKKEWIYKFPGDDSTR